MMFYFPLQNGVSHVYGICLGFSFLVAGIVLHFLLKNKMPFQYNILFLLMSGFCILVGAKEMSLILGQGTNLFNAGFSSIGGVLGLFFSIWFMDRLTNKEHIYLKETIKIIPLMYSISKLGCFFSGCCYGFVYDGFLHVEYIHGSYFPVQLVESIVFFFLFIGFYKTNKPYTVIIVCALAKFILDYFRYSHNGIICSINQILCLCIVLFCMFFVKKELYVHNKLDLK